MQKWERMRSFCKEAESIRICMRHRHNIMHRYADKFFFMGLCFMHVNRNKGWMCMNIRRALETDIEGINRCFARY